MSARILLIISGGVAAYKTPELVRRLRERGIAPRCVLTAGGAQFVTPLALGAVTEDKVYTDLFSLTDEAEMGHIRLSREADLVLVAPASADLLAKMAAGLADDLASTALLATDKPVWIAPAMNVRMWTHPATQANLETLVSRGVGVIGPEEGGMACGEFGMGRMSEPATIVDAMVAALQRAVGAAPLKGRRALVTSGPTREPLDPVRYLSNHSSGKQGHAIAAALAALGAETVLVAGPCATPPPPGVSVMRVETAQQMLAACEAALPAGGRRLAPGRGRDIQNEEVAGYGTAQHRAGSQPRHFGDAVPVRTAAPAFGRWVRRGNRCCGGQRGRQTGAQGL